MSVQFTLANNSLGNSKMFVMSLPHLLLKWPVLQLKKSVTCTQHENNILKRTKLNVCVQNYSQSNCSLNINCVV